MVDRNYVFDGKTVVRTYNNDLYSKRSEIGAIGKAGGFWENPQHIAIFHMVSILGGLAQLLDRVQHSEQY